MKSRFLALIAGILLLLVLMACAPDTASPVVDVDTPTVEPITESVPEDESITEAEKPVDEKGDEMDNVEMSVPLEVNEALLQTVLVDAYKRVGAEAPAVRVLKAEPAVWPDGGLGCPEEGMMYTQVMVDGYQIVLEIDGEIYDYRGGDEPRLCTNPEFAFKS